MAAKNAFAISSDDELRQAISGLDTAGVYDIIDAVSKWVLVFGVILAVIALAIGGNMLLASRGNAERVSKGKKAVAWAVVGLMLILLARGIVVVIGEFL